MKVSKETIIRTVLLLLALLNQALTAAGRSVLPISDDQVTEAISTAFTVVTALLAWWKNNSFTQNALKADKVLEDLNAREDCTDE